MAAMRVREASLKPPVRAGYDNYGDEFVSERRSTGPLSSTAQHLTLYTSMPRAESPYVLRRGTQTPGMKAPRAATIAGTQTQEKGRPTSSQQGDVLSRSGQQMTSNNQRPMTTGTMEQMAAAGAPYGLTATGHALPHPDWQRIHPNAIPNQHGHVLLSQYSMKPPAGGLGYGRKHRTYFQYLSHYKQEVDESVIQANHAAKFVPKPCDPHYAMGLGYGPRHEEHYWYLAPKTVQDL